MRRSRSSSKNNKLPTANPSHLVLKRNTILETVPPRKRNLTTTPSRRKRIILSNSKRQNRSRPRKWHPLRKPRRMSRSKSSRKILSRMRRNKNCIRKMNLPRRKAIKKMTKKRRKKRR